jgi:glycosyltransferase involved in cell wall biosynthesis
LDINVSYLVPSFNHAEYVLAALDSIFNDASTLDSDFEIVIVDDASTDGSKSILRALIDDSANGKKIKLLLSSKNQGIAATFNKLIEASSGEYLRFCASDDLLVPGSTSAMIKILKLSPRLQCVFADGCVINAEGNEICESLIEYHGGRLERLSAPATMADELLYRWCLAGPTFLVHREYYRTMKYDEALFIEDFDLYLTLLEVPGSLVFLNDRVCKYRIHGENISKTIDVERRIKNQNLFLGIINKHIENGALKSRLVPLRYVVFAKISYLHGKYIFAACFYSLYILCRFLRF